MLIVIVFFAAANLTNQSYFLLVNLEYATLNFNNIVYFMTQFKYKFTSSALYMITCSVTLSTLDMITISLTLSTLDMITFNVHLFKCGEYALNYYEPIARSKAVQDSFRQGRSLIIQQCISTYNVQFFLKAYSFTKCKPFNDIPN